MQNPEKSGEDYFLIDDKIITRNNVERNLSKSTEDNRWLLALLKWIQICD